MKEVASVGQQGDVVVFDLAHGETRWRIVPGMPTSGYTVAASPDGSLIASSTALFRVADGAKLMGLFGSPGWVYSAIYGAAFSPNGKMLYCVTSGGWLLAIDVNGRKIVETLRIDTTLVSLDISPDGTRLITGEDEGAVRLWSVAPFREEAIIGRHAARVKSVAFAPDMKTAASAGDDKRIALWDVDRRRLRMNIGTHATPVYAIAFSPDGKRLVSGEHDRTVRIYTRERSLWGMRLE
jgi:WD40 repeat protein